MDLNVKPKIMKFLENMINLSHGLGRDFLDTIPNFNQSIEQINKLHTIEI